MSGLLVLHIYSTVKNHFLMYICPCSILMHTVLKKSNLHTQSRVGSDVLVLGMMKVTAFILVQWRPNPEKVNKFEFLLPYQAFVII